MAIERVTFEGGKLIVERNGREVTITIVSISEYDAIEYYERITAAAEDGQVDLTIITRPGNIGC